MLTPMAIINSPPLQISPCHQKLPFDCSHLGPRSHMHASVRNALRGKLYRLVQLPRQCPSRGNASTSSDSNTAHRAHKRSQILIPRIHSFIHSASNTPEQRSLIHRFAMTSLKLATSVLLSIVVLAPLLATGEPTSTFLDAWSGLGGYFV